MTQQSLLIDTPDLVAQDPRGYTHGQQINIKDYIPKEGDFLVLSTGDTGEVKQELGDWVVQGVSVTRADWVIFIEV